MKKFLAIISHKNTFFIILVSCIFTLLRLPSFFEPYWYGDEGIYEVIGFALRHGRMLYTGIWDNKPPLLYLVYALVDGNQQGAKILSWLFGLCSIILFFFFVKKIFRNYKGSQNATFITTALFAFLFATPFLEGNIANAENFMILPILAAAFFVWNYLEKNNVIFLCLSGLLLGIAFLFKVVSVFDFGAFFLFVFIIQYRNIQYVIKQIMHLFLFGISFAIPIIVTLLFFFSQGILKIALQSMFFSNIGYVGYGNTFIIPQGLLIIKLLALMVFSFIIFLKRKKLSPTISFIFLWFAFSLFSAYFSQRPYTHYVLVLLSSSCMLIGLCFLAKRMRLLLSTIVLLIFAYIFITFALYNNLPKSFFTYYVNFISYMAGQKNTQDYYAFFDKVTPRDYALSDFINLHKKPGDQVFIWGNSGQIYKLTNILPVGKYIVAYHLTSTPQIFSAEKALLEKSRPRFVIILPNQSDIPFSLKGYKAFFFIDNASIYAKVF